MEYPEHLNYFTPATFRALLAGQGFREVSLVTTGLSVGDLLGGLPVPPSADAGGESVDMRIRSSAEHSQALGNLKRAANGILAATQLGDTIKARYERG